MLKVAASTIVPLDIVYLLILLSILFGALLFYFIHGLIEQMGQSRVPAFHQRWKNITLNKRILNSYEYAFYQALLPAATTLQLMVCPKMSLLEIVRGKDGKVVKKAKQYRYLCHHQVDFAICSPRGELLMVFMLTGADGIADESRLKAEEIQQLLKTIGVPLTKIEMKSKYSAASLHNILSQL